MLEYQQPPQQALPELFSAPDYALNPPANPAALEARIEDYLDHVCAPLVGVAPYAMRQEMRAEMRTHLDSLIAAHCELGSASEEAVTAALRQFGDAGAVARNWTRECARSATETTAPQSARPATLAALGLFGLPYLADATHIAWSAWSKFSADEAAFYRFELVAVPLLAGLLTGLLARHRAARGTLNALALLAIPAMVIPGFLLSLVYAGLVDKFPFEQWIPNPIPATVGLTYWVSLGCAGAKAGNWLRQRTARLRPRLALR